MAPRLIGKTTFAGLHPVLLDGQPVLEMHARLQTMLGARLGPAAAALFAEPIVTRAGPEPADPGSVSWYTEVPGTVETLAAGSPDARAMAERRLRDLVRQLGPLLHDPDVGPLLRRALAIARPESLMTVGGAPVLMGWGLTMDPSGSEDDVAARAARWMADYADAAPAAPPAAAAAPSSARPSPANPVAAAMAARATRPAWDWALLPVMILLAALFMAAGVYAGTRMMAARVAERPTTVTLLDEAATRDAMARQRDQNTALEKEIEARRRLLAGNVCVADPAQLPRLGPDRAVPVQPGAVVPPPPGGQAFQGTLAELLTQAVVLIVAPQSGSDGGVATGTGFFVAPDLIATNRHVIEDADPGQLVVTSRKLARMTRVQLVAQTENSEIGSPDIALLRVEPVPGIQPLAFSTTVAPLDQVIAAGFPGLLMQSDEAFARLRQGDASAVPEVILTDGRVNAIQSSAAGMKIMPHSAAVSGGNSGGPLVDACGRVVGINTFITANRQQVVHANYAQKADAVVAFLRQHGANVADVVAPCAPASLVPAPAVPPAPPPPPTPR